LQNSKYVGLGYTRHRYRTCLLGDVKDVEKIYTIVFLYTELHHSPHAICVSAVDKINNTLQHAL